MLLIYNLLSVLIKSKVSTNLEKQRLSFISHANSSSEIMVIEKLNQPQGLSLSISQSATSEIPANNIVIAPYCHHEVDGTVVWFWCQSRYGQGNLQRMYESGSLLEKLSTIFRQFSSSSVLPASKLLSPTSINISGDDLAKNRRKCKYSYIYDSILNMISALIRAPYCISVCSSWQFKHKIVLFTELVYYTQNI